MKNKKIKKVTHDHEYIESITCDICKKEYEGQFWETDGYEILETEITMRTGSQYPEGGSGEKITFDICPTCFEEKLIPALKAMGAEPTLEDWSN